MEDNLEIFNQVLISRAPIFGPGIADPPPRPASTLWGAAFLPLRLWKGMKGQPPSSPDTSSCLRFTLSHFSPAPPRECGSRWDRSSYAGRGQLVTVGHPAAGSASGHVRAATGHSWSMYMCSPAVLEQSGSTNFANFRQFSRIFAVAPNFDRARAERAPAAYRR